MILDASTVDNINNFTAAGKAAAKSQADKASQSLFGTTQDFIRMLTVQLQNQDPTKPLDTSELTQQIAQLSGVEQQINTNKNLESLMALFAQSQTYNNVSYIGKFMEAPGNLSSLLNGQATFVYNLAAVAKDTQLTITDPDGNVVYNTDGTGLAGRNTFNWNGTDNAGKKVADGVYKIEVKAKDDLGKIVESVTSSSGTITSVETLKGIHYVASGNLLMQPGQAISVR